MILIIMNAIAAFILSYLIIGGLVFIAMVIVMQFHKPHYQLIDHSQPIRHTR